MDRLSFEACLKYEQENQPMADEVLAKIYPDKNIRRCTYEHDKVLQQHDVDVVVTNKTGWPNDWCISEKFRSQYYNDVLIELWDNFKKRSDGWAIKTTAHEHYFYHKTSEGHILRIVPTWLIKRIAKVAREAYEERFEEILSQEPGRRLLYPVTFMGHKCHILMVPTTIKWGIPTYYGANIIIPMELINYINQRPIPETNVKNILCNSQENKSSNEE